MKNSTIKKGLNPKKKARIPAGWVTARKAAYKADRIARHKRMRERLPTAEEQAIITRKLEIMALHEAGV